MPLGCGLVGCAGVVYVRRQPLHYILCYCDMGSAGQPSVCTTHVQMVSHHGPGGQACCHGNCTMTKHCSPSHTQAGKFTGFWTTQLFVEQMYEPNSFNTSCSNLTQQGKERHATSLALDLLGQHTQYWQQCDYITLENTPVVHNQLKYVLQGFYPVKCKCSTGVHANLQVMNSRVKL